MSLFKQKSQQPRKRLAQKTKFPSGVVVCTPEDKFFVKGDVLLRIPNDNVFNSWSFPIVVDIEKSAIEGYLVAGKLGYRDGTILEAIGSRKLYLVSAQKVRHITSTTPFWKLGKDWTKDVLLVSDEDIKLHKEGEPIGRI